MRETKELLIELEDKIAEASYDLDKANFLIAELFDYDSAYDITPRKALEYDTGRERTKEGEVASKFCYDYKRIMNLVHVTQDYLNSTDKKIESILNYIRDEYEVVIKEGTV